MSLQQCMSAPAPSCDRVRSGSERQAVLSHSRSKHLRTLAITIIVDLSVASPFCQMQYCLKQAIINLPISSMYVWAAQLLHKLQSIATEIL